VPVKRRETVGRSDRILRGYKDDDVSLQVILKLASESGVPASWIIFGETPSQLDSNFALVPRLEVRASAGAGAIALTESADEFLPFKLDWLRRIGINPRFARTMFAHGDSMEPTISDGDLMLIDESVHRIVDQGIYVVVYDGLVLVKRVQIQRDGGVVLKSDNPRYDPEAVPADEVTDIRVAGRVRWYGRTV
jgi:phage repressor protein C with HTH and peptisase S24 domain